MDIILQILNTNIVDPTYSVSRQIIVTWVFLYITALITYFFFCTPAYWYYFTPRDKNKAMWKYDGEQLREEMWTSTWSAFIMAGMTAPIEVAVVYGYGRVYPNVSDYGWWYIPCSCILFLLFTDSLIYWIHRGLHHPKLYWIHKLHHRYKNTTPYSAFSFHPLDGWSQGFPYHLFVFFFPMHKYLYLLVLFLVGLWTMNIHDRFTLDIPGVNGAAHHTIHHTKFLYNYGQYFTFWDRMMQTWKDPWSETPYKEVAAGLVVPPHNDRDGPRPFDASTLKPNGANGHTEPASSDERGSNGTSHRSNGAARDSTNGSNGLHHD